MFDELKISLEERYRVKIDLGVIEYFLEQVEGGYYEVTGSDKKQFNKLEDALAYMVLQAGVLY